MAGVEEEVRTTIDSAVQKLIDELAKERAVSAKLRKLNLELVAKLTSIEEEKARDKRESDLLVHQLRLQIDELRSQNKEEMAMMNDDSDSSDSAAANTAESKEIESIGEFVNKEVTKNVDPLMNKRRHKLIQVINIMRFQFRDYFGLSFANHCGFYVDRIMSKLIFDYYEWIDYPKGDSILEKQTSDVWAAAVSTDGYYLYTGDQCGRITAFNMVDHLKIGQWSAHSKSVLSLAYRSGLIVSGSADNMIHKWNARNFKLIRTLKGHTDIVVSTIFNNQGDLLISGSLDRSIRVWMVGTGECLKVLMGHEQRVDSLLFADNMIISGSTDGCMKVWDQRNYKELRSFTEGIYQTVYDLTMNCDKSLLCCVWHKRSIIYSWPEMRVERTMDINATCCAFHPLLPHILVLADYSNQENRMYDVRNGELIHRSEGHTDEIFNISFSPDGSRIVSASQQTVRICDVEFFLNQ